MPKDISSLVGLEEAFLDKWVPKEKIELENGGREKKNKNQNTRNKKMKRDEITKEQDKGGGGALYEED